MAAPRPNLLALIAVLLLGAACKRAPVEVPSETPDLPPPTPASALIVTPLDTAATGYTNEMQAANLSRESSELGIQHIGKHLEDGESDRDGADAPPPLTEAQKKEHMARLKNMRLEFTRARRSIEDAQDKSVALTGSTAAMIAGRESGALLGAAADGPGVWSGAYGGAVETGELVVSDAAAWTELWGRLSRETPPDVDFTKTRIAAVFVGPRPTSGYRARLIEIAAEPTRYLLRWFEEGPAPDEAVADGATAPFLLVAIPKDDRALRWDKVRSNGLRTKRPKIK